MRPNNGNPGTQKSEIKVIYDDFAIYIGGIFYDTFPDSILSQLSKRDELGAIDYCGVYIDPYNDGQTAYGFFVSVAGVQCDLKMTSSEDATWNAVWKSETKITKQGWVVEMSIPYSALRFPTKDVQTWGINFFRTVQRYREMDCWNYINAEISNTLYQQGELVGIQNVKSPIRLSATPYFSAYTTKDKDNSAYSLKGGVDLKYGINESFTLDMMLIPDFGQVQSDNQTLNLTPYELYYDEKRSFFMEGTELFSKGDIFYSRRIGAKPKRYSNVEDNLNTNESISENPTETQLINATKITGKTKSGLSIGFLNAMSLKSEATIKDDVTGNTRKIQTQPFTNYNIFVLDQSLKNNSYISLINSDVYIGEDKYIANVTATEFKFANKNNSFAFSGNGAVSQIHNDGNSNYGFLYLLTLAKTSGKFRYSISQQTIDDKYNPNDLGYLSKNNYLQTTATLAYNFYTPFWKMLNWYNSLSFTHTSQYLPREFEKFAITFNTNPTFRNHLTMALNVTYQPGEKFDFDEPRSTGRYIIYPSLIDFYYFASSDYSKKFAYDIQFEYSKWNEFCQRYFWYYFSPRIRFSDKWLFIFSISDKMTKNDIGYANATDNQIVFGKRDVKNITNTISTNYIFNNSSSLSLEFRHNWTTVEYNKYYYLQKNGRLSDANDYSNNHNNNYNAFTIDLGYVWQFAPGSEISIVWKNEIYTDSDVLMKNYFENFDKTINSPQKNSISVKVLYYLDYLYLKKRNK